MALLETGQLGEQCEARFSALFSRLVCLAGLGDTTGLPGLAALFSSLGCPAVAAVCGVNPDPSDAGDVVGAVCGVVAALARTAPRYLPRAVAGVAPSTLAGPQPSRLVSCAVLTELARGGAGSNLLPFLLPALLAAWEQPATDPHCSRVRLVVLEGLQGAARTADSALAALVVPALHAATVDQDPDLALAALQVVFVMF